MERLAYISGLPYPKLGSPLTHARLGSCGSLVPRGPWQGVAAPASTQVRAALPLNGGDPAGEIYFPQAKTLGTHKIYFEPSIVSVCGSRRRDQLVKRIRISRYVTLSETADRPLPFHHVFVPQITRPGRLTDRCSVFIPPNPTNIQPNMADIQERLKKLGQGARIGGFYSIVWK